MACILGLGSNWGAREAYLQQAMEQLRDVLHDMRCSSVWESAALLKEGAPTEWGVPFLNMAVAGSTALSPEALLRALKAIEQRIGRTHRGIWAPREIDIDILAMGDTVLQSAMLTVPHAELLKRDFALLPLAEISGDWRYPVAGEYYGMTAREVLANKSYAAHAGLRRLGAL